MEIIIGFSRAKSIFKIGSLLIQEVEKRKFSHVYVKINAPSTGVSMVAQASHGTVNIISYDIFKETNIVVEEYTIPCSEEHHKQILTFICNNAGKPYGSFQLVLIGIKKIFGFEINIRDGDEKFICSEWGGRICQIAAVDISTNLDYETPSDLNSLLKKLGYKANG